jgi:hypothetical protein
MSLRCLEVMNIRAAKVPTLKRLVVYCLSHTPSLFFALVILETGSCFKFPFITGMTGTLYHLFPLENRFHKLFCSS